MASEKHKRVLVKLKKEDQPELCDGCYYFENEIDCPYNCGDMIYVVDTDPEER